MQTFKVSDEHTKEYDQRFDLNDPIYQSELQAVRQLLPPVQSAIGIDVGTGRFAVPLGIRLAIEPATALARVAHKRRITVARCIAEKLLVSYHSFDLVLIVLTLCLVENPKTVLAQVRRILRHKGTNIVAVLNRESNPGKQYHKKQNSKLCNNATFRTIDELVELLNRAGFETTRLCQTVFGKVKGATCIHPVKDGYAEGGFLVVTPTVAEPVQTETTIRPEPRQKILHPGSTNKASPAQDSKENK